VPSWSQSSQPCQFLVRRHCTDTNSVTALLKLSGEKDYSENLWRDVPSRSSARTSQSEEWRLRPSALADLADREKDFSSSSRQATRESGIRSFAEGTRMTFGMVAVFVMLLLVLTVEAANVRCITRTWKAYGDHERSDPGSLQHRPLGG